MNTKTGHLGEGTFKSGLEGKVKIKWECGRCIRPFDLWYVLPEGLLERNKCMVTKAPFTLAEILLATCSQRGGNR